MPPSIFKRKYWPALALSIVGCLLLASCAPNADPPQARPTPPAQPIALGVNLPDAPDSALPLYSYTHEVGRAPAVVMWYQSWSEPLYYPDQKSVMSRFSATPLITWDPVIDGQGVRFDNIAAGDDDDYIRASARLAAAWGRPLLVRFAHEMNLPGPPFDPRLPGNSPQDFVAAWRHVVDVFRQMGATNVRWVWAPNVDCNGNCPFDAFYPGDPWVDWVGLSGYNNPSFGGWQSMEQVMGSSYRKLTALTDKPVMIAETSSSQAGGDKASWIRQGLLQQVPTDMPRVRALIWFDRLKDADWRIDSSPASLAAFREVVESPLYSGTLSGPLG